MLALSSSGTSVGFYQTTRRKIPEDSRVRTRRHENLTCVAFFWVLYLKLPGLVRDGVSVGGGQLAGAGLSPWTPTLAFHPRRLVQINLAAYCPGATLRKVLLVVLCKLIQIFRLHQT